MKNPARWRFQSRLAAFGCAFAALLLGLVSVAIEGIGLKLGVAGIPAGLLLVSILLPIGLWSLAMWHEGLQRRIGSTNRMDEDDRIGR